MPFGLPQMSCIGYPAPMLCPAHAGLGFREAHPWDAAEIGEHYARLSAEDLRLRFCASLSDEALAAHLDGLWDRAGLVIGAFDGPLWRGPFHAAGPVLALIEVTIDRRDAEFGISVDPALRRRGVGTYLVQTAARLLAPRGVRRLFATTLPRNRAMIGLARNSGAAIEGDVNEVELIFDVAELERSYLARRLTPPGMRIAV